MPTPDELLERHAQNPLEGARRLVARYGSDPAFASAALRWCQNASVRGLGTLEGEPRRKQEQTRAVLALLAATSAPESFFGQLLETARGKPSADKESDGTCFALLACLVELWPQRDSSHVQLGQALLSWAHSPVGRQQADAISLTLAEFPELAYGMLGPVPQTIDTSGPCRRCGKMHTSSPEDFAMFSELWHPLQLLQHRQRRALSPHALDQETLQSLPVDLVLQDPFTTGILREMHVAGQELPAKLLVAAEAALAATDPRLGSAEPRVFFNSFYLLSAMDQKRELAINSLAAWCSVPAWVRVTPFPEKLLLLLEHSWRGIFTGHGFGRDDRARKLLPLSRAFLGQGLWPTKLWGSWLRAKGTGTIPFDQLAERKLIEASEEATREVLGEALLSYALDANEATQVRLAALDAIELLVPGGDGSIIRALAKVDPVELKTRAKGVQQAMKRRRGAPLDPELGIQDACERFLPVMLQKAGL
jgi:hypothetical protein